MAMYQGGGVTSHANVKNYINLIVEDFSSIEKEFPQTAELFATYAKHYQGKSNFGYAELRKDNRLSNKLSKTEAGADFFKKIRNSLPLITISNKILGDVNNIHNVKLIKLSDFEKDPIEALNKIVSSVELSTKNQENKFYDGIAKLNKILSLKPGFFGLSLNINAIIDDWIEKKRSKNLPIEIEKKNISKTNNLIGK